MNQILEKTQTEIDQAFILSESFLKTKTDIMPKTLEVLLMNTDKKFIHWRINMFGSLTDKLISHLKKNGSLFLCNT